MATAQDPEIVIRSLLFCPANEPRKVAKLSLSGADAGVLDLEDAVASREKPAARAGVRAALASLRGLLRCVRVNSLETGLGEEDVVNAVCPDLDAIVLPKIETVQDLRRFDRLIASAEAANGMPIGRVKAIVLIETAAGIRAAGDIAAFSGRLLRIALGSGDLGNDLALPTILGELLGGASVRSRQARLRRTRRGVEPAPGRPIPERPRHRGSCGRLPHESFPRLWRTGLHSPRSGLRSQPDLRPGFRRRSISRARPSRPSTRRSAGDRHRSPSRAFSSIIPSFSRRDGSSASPTRSRGASN